MPKSQGQARQLLRNSHCELRAGSAAGSCIRRRSTLQAAQCLAGPRLTRSVLIPRPALAPLSCSRRPPPLSGTAGGSEGVIRVCDLLETFGFQIRRLGPGPVYPIFVKFLIRVALCCLARADGGGDPGIPTRSRAAKLLGITVCYYAVTPLSQLPTAQLLGITVCYYAVTPLSQLPTAQSKVSNTPQSWHNVPHQYSSTTDTAAEVGSDLHWIMKENAH